MQRVVLRDLGIRHWELAVALLGVAMGSWLVTPALGWAGVAVILALTGIGLAIRGRAWRGVATTVVGLLAALSSFQSSRRVRDIEVRWDERREELIQTASARLDEELFQAVRLAGSLADTAAAVAPVSTSEAFARLERAVRRDAPEHGAIVMDSTGRALVWAGRHRIAPETGASGLAAHITPFYVILEARRQNEGLTGIGQVLLAADSAVPDRGRSVAQEFARRTGSTLLFYSPDVAPASADVFDYTLDVDGRVDTLFSVQAVPPFQGDLKLQTQADGGRRVAALAVATLLLLMLTGGPLVRWLAGLAVALLFVFTPAGERLIRGGLFSEASYFLDVLGPVSASMGRLIVASALAITLLALIAQRGVRRTVAGTVASAALIILAPFIIVFLASGITPPTSAIGLSLWLSWQGGLAICGAAVVLAAALLIRGKTTALAPRWVTLGAVLWAATNAGAGLWIWDPVSGWPLWYAFLWLPPILLAALPASRARMVLGAAVVAGVGAALLTWGAVLDGRLLLAERDSRRVSEGDPVPMGGLERFAETLRAGPVPRTAAELYAQWRRSPLSQEDYLAVLAIWGPDNSQVARLDLAEFDLRTGLLQHLAASARDSAVPLRDEIVQPRVIHYVESVPFDDGTVVTVAVGPRSRLYEPVRVARFLKGERRFYAPYEMAIGEPVENLTDAAGRIGWQRSDWIVRGARTLNPQDEAGGRYHLHVQIPLGGPLRVLVRGALVVFLNSLLIGALWLGGEALLGAAAIPRRVRESLRLRSYRTRLTIALAGFFVLPTLGYAAWSVARLRAEAAARGDLLIEKTMEDAERPARPLGQLPSNELGDRLASLAEGLNADLLWYEGGALRQSNPSVLAELGLVDRYLPPDVYLRFALRDEVEVTTNAVMGGQPTRVGYRNLGGLPPYGTTLGVPRLVDARDLQSEQEDLLYGLLLTTLVGLAGAVLLAGVAGRSLAYPVQALRSAAVAVGRGQRLPPFDPNVPPEFTPVVDAFERMARDIELSQAALEAARQRTAAVLQNVATGVVALDAELCITIANPQAERLLAAPLPSGAHVYAIGGADWAPVWAWVREFLSADGSIGAQEFVVGSRQIRAQLATIHGQPAGCVLALDDTTDLARAVRVLAWGELARQVAHEIKNPLTPIRLGVQHLERVYRDRSGEFGPTLDRTSKQILAEIERLDAIARAFARFGAPPAEAAPLTSADLVAIARETAELYALAGGTKVTVESGGPVVTRVRRDEVKEVLVNLIENARDAGAGEVVITLAHRDGAATVTVVDDGSGIPAGDLPLVFEPHFSTTTSGTGLGLAICKRLVESWGAEISVRSQEGRGAEVRIVIPVDGEGAV